MTNKNAAPERRVTKNPDGTFTLGMWKGFQLVQTVTLSKDDLRAFAAAIQPNPTESDEAVADGFTQALEAWKAKMDSLPMGHEDAQKGASTYNWMHAAYNFFKGYHRQSTAQPVPHVEVSKTAEELVRKLQGECMCSDEFFYDAELAKPLIQAALDAHALRAGEKVREAAVKTEGRYGDTVRENIRALDIATILKGDK